MLIAIIGESCTGKSTLAKRLNDDIGFKIYTGKDYLKLSKNENDSKEIFKKILNESSNSKNENIIYVISEKEHISLLPEKAFKIVIFEDLDTIKARFKERLHGNLPLPVEKMIEQKHGIFDHENCNIKIVSSDFDYDELLIKIKSL